MRQKKIYLISLIPAFFYWGMASYILFSVMEGFDTGFPAWLESIFMPGYYIGFIVGFLAGNGFAVLAQLISLVCVYVFFLFIVACLYGWNSRKS